MPKVKVVCTKCREEIPSMKGFDDTFWVELHKCKEKQEAISIMNKFDHAFNFVLKWEGGYVNDPIDPGGETNMGISRRSYPNEDIKNMTIERAKKIYHRDYWLRACCDTLNPELGLVVFDCAVNMGVSKALHIIRIVLLRDPGTLVAQVVSFTSRRLLTYVSYKNFARYGKGWALRTIDACKVALLHD